ncbi:MAG: serine hydrolase [Bryobacteraceae bacterium]
MIRIGCLLVCAFFGLVYGQAADSQIVLRLDELIHHEMEDKGLQTLSIAIVDHDRVVWSRDYGAGPDTVYRVGSVSKLFTDIGIMQLVERGEIDLDAPVTRYLPEFHPKNPFGKPITLRQLMSHRAGLVREPPVGHYFDDSGPSLKQTVASLNETALVYAPGSHTKYSNAGIAVVGDVLETTQHTPFSQYLKTHVLQPLGMQHSAFTPQPELIRNLAKSFMWTYDGRVFEAPKFELGMAPAGCMYSTTGDLARFVMDLFTGGRGVIRRETLEKMWTPQFEAAGQKTGYGLGFRIAEVKGRRVIGHGGAIYGFATELEALPEDQIGVAAITTKDSANAVVNHIARQAVEWLIAERLHRPLPAAKIPVPLPGPEAARLTGAYPDVEITNPGGKLYATPFKSGYRIQFKKSGDDLVADDVLAFGSKLKLDAAKRVFPPPAPPDIPKRWQGLIGEYGWDYDTLYILERGGKLTALIEWFSYDPLEDISENEFRFPDAGLYAHEPAAFTRDAAGRAVSVRVGGVLFPRRPDPASPGATFHLTPVKPVAELRAEALKANPPAEKGDFRKPELVELVKLDPAIHLDIRYATSNNFMRTPFYREARAFMQRPAADAAVRADQSLRRLGYGLLIHDAYRPWYVTKMFWDGTPPDKHNFVADPSQGSRHNRGCAVDLTLYDAATGKPIQMTGGYDEMSTRSYPEYPGGTALQRWHRDLLRRMMEAEGFQVNEFEWWHFDYKDWSQYPILNQDFGAIR